MKQAFYEYMTNTGCPTLINFQAEVNTCEDLAFLLSKKIPEILNTAVSAIATSADKVLSDWGYLCSLCRQLVGVPPSCVARHLSIVLHGSTIISLPIAPPTRSTLTIHLPFICSLIFSFHRSPINIEAIHVPGFDCVFALARYYRLGRSFLCTPFFFGKLARYNSSEWNTPFPIVRIFPPWANNKL